MESYGPFFALVWVFCTLFVIFGLFNLIMAIFVENTIEHGKHDNNLRRQQRHIEQVRMAQKLQTLIIRLCSYDPEDRFESEIDKAPLKTLRTQLAYNIHRLFCRLFSTNNYAIRAISRKSSDTAKFELSHQSFGQLEPKITHKAFQEMVERSDIRSMLDDLDISPNCRKNLFAVLDADGDQCLTVNELVEGLLRLRGDPEKSDTIATLLATRSVQSRTRTLESIALKQQQNLSRIEENQNNIAYSLQKLLLK